MSVGSTQVRKKMQSVIHEACLDARPLGSTSSASPPYEQYGEKLLLL